MSFLKEVNRENLILILKVKIPFILLISVLNCNAQDKSDDFYGYYFSNQSTDFDKIILYHFSRDSLHLFNSATRQNLKFSAEYISDTISLSNSHIDNYKLSYKIKNNKVVNLIDSNTQLSFNNENKLVKFKVDDKINIKDLNNKFWKRNFENGDKLIWYFDLNTKRIDEYTIYNNSNTKICNPSIRAFFKFKDVYVIDYFMSGDLYVMTKTDNNILNFKTLSPKNELENYNFLEHKIKERKVSIQGKWQRIEASNPHVLPEVLNITNNIINIDDTIVKYRLGIDNKFIIYKKDNRGNCIKIKKLNNQELKLKTQQTVPHGKETSHYKRAR